MSFDYYCYLWLMVFGFVGLSMLMMASSRHQKKFTLKLSIPTRKKIAVLMLLVSLLPLFFVPFVVYFLMAWCLLLSFSAGLIYVALIYYEWQQTQKQIK